MQECHAWDTECILGVGQACGVRALTPASVRTVPRAVCEQAPLLPLMAAPGLAVGASCPCEGVGARNNRRLYHLMDLFIYIDSVKLFGSLWVLV